MPPNKNKWILKLLAWHGHDRGGVHVPFNEYLGNPLRGEDDRSSVIITGIIKKLRSLAHGIAHGKDVPRCIFLVGGPGNGKSEAVEDFIKALDDELGCNGELINILTKKFATGSLVPWKAEVLGNVPELPTSFEEKIGRLILIQDASACEDREKNAAKILSEYIMDLVTHPPPPPVLICCVNRGLLSHALRFAYNLNMGPDVIQIIQGLIRATSLGKEVLSANRPRCWPLELPASNQLLGNIACWPMDMESMLLDTDENSPINQIIERAVCHPSWEETGKCANCESLEMCPFHQNAAWLKDPFTRNSLLKILRRAELSTGQKWNFRETFSIIAEIIVGEWTDFTGAEHPCKWVHEWVAKYNNSENSTIAVEATLHLLEKLYPHALFPVKLSSGLQDEIIETAGENNCDITIAISNYLKTNNSSPLTYIRNFLIETLAKRLDPACLSPQVQEHPIRNLEDSYSQSVKLGTYNWPDDVRMSMLEKKFFELAEKAEEEWNPIERESFQVLTASKFLKSFCSMLAKRSVAVRMGFHGNEDYLKAYENVIRNRDALSDLTGVVRDLLGDGGFFFNALESFGQPQQDSEWFITLEGTMVTIQPFIPAPTTTETIPAHDFPFIDILGHPMPLTFDLYMALRLRQDGCKSSSLPANVRASIDRIRHLYAGKLCRDTETFAGGAARYVVNHHGKILLRQANDLPIYRENG